MGIGVYGRSFNVIKAEGILENYTGPGLGLIGGLVFTAVVIASILLVRNMNMRIKRLPDDFDDQPSSAQPNDEQDDEGLTPFGK